MKKRLSGKKISFITRSYFTEASKLSDGTSYLTVAFVVNEAVEQMKDLLKEDKVKITIEKVLT